MFIKEILRVSCLLTFYLIAYGHLDVPILGPADIYVKQILQCENPEQYSSYLKVERRKINRTHDIFNLEMKTDLDIDETVSIYLNFEKWGDGGYKPNYLIINESACEVLFNYLRNDIMHLMKLVGRPQKCPIKAGFLRWVNYSIDYRKLPQEVLYGKFKGRFYYVKDGVRKLCIQLIVEVTPKKIFRNQ